MKIKTQTKQELFNIIDTLNGNIAGLEIVIEELRKPVPPPPEPPTIPKPKFAVGDPVVSNLGEYCDFICEAGWVESMKTWRYGINYSQHNMCSNERWQDGGSGYSTSEADLKEPSGMIKLQGELWRQLRIEMDLKRKLKDCQWKYSALRTALETVNPPPTPLTHS